MCGISTVITLKRRSTTSNGNVNGINQNGHANGNSSHLPDDITVKLTESLDIINHRGPDARDIWINPENTIALGHCRLSINDLSDDGLQPLHDDKGHIHAVVNGEIYDNDRLREECITKFGYKFKSHSDSETVVALYKHCNGTPAFLDHMRGEFSVVVYDDRTDKIIAARDRYGVKPLFYTVLDDKLLIASELKAFLPLGLKPEWDLESLMLGGWFNSTSMTNFKGVRKVEPGKYMVITAEGNIQSYRYWDSNYPDKHVVETRSVEDMVLAVREKLIESIRIRLRADVPVGIYLSGGLDSSAVAGIVKHLVERDGEKMGNRASTERLACFCISFDKKSGFDESQIAERTADSLGVNMYTIDMGEAELAQYFEDATWHNEHQTFDLNTVGKYRLSTLPREKGFKVILSGEGADELFVGYPWFPGDFLREPDYSMPDLYLQKNSDQRKELLKEFDTNFWDRMSNLGFMDTAADERVNKMQNEQTNGISNPLIFANAQGLHKVLVRPLQQKCDSADRLACVINNNWAPDAQEKIKTTWHPVHSSLYSWSKGHLTSFILTSLGDRCEMAHSIEGRPPFLDHKLAELVNSMPPSVKLHYGPDVAGPTLGDTSAWKGLSQDNKFWEKWILREAARPFITDELYNRRKHPFTAPNKYHRGNPIHSLFKRLLTRENVDDLGFLDWEAVKEMKSKAFGDDADLEAFRLLHLAATLVVIGKRFGVARAEV
ncbi:asparagine synthase [Xylariaceae sp. FL0255]|nr:asparagine synthase [Xylariaceae sp. FL0255]